MKLNPNKKDEFLNLTQSSKNLLIWIQLQTLQEDKIECSYSLYSKEVNVSLNTFKKAIGGLLDSRILYATSLKGKFKLNEEFFYLEKLLYSKEFLEEAKREWEEWLNSEAYKSYKEKGKN